MRFDMGQTFRIISVLALFFGTWAITGLVRRYALRKGVLDIPNHRSSHSVTTPRGGGLSFVLVFNVFVLIYSVTAHVSLHMVIGLIGAGVIIAVLGWFDDRKNLSAGFRFAVHIIAAIWAVSWIGGLQEISIGCRTLRLGFAGSILAVVGIVWSINLYNFMDGIDGFSGAEAVTVATFGGLLSLLANNLLLAHFSFALAISVGGFLIWNWPPAKIFMGDVGSCFLGLTFAYLALFSEKTGGAPLIVWLILLSVFIADATLTVIRRQMSGEKWYEAHRSHVYQLAVQAGYSHKEVTVKVIFMNACLGVIALIAMTFQRFLLPLCIIVYGLLLLLHWRLYAKWADGNISISKTNGKQDVSSS